MTGLEEKIVAGVVSWQGALEYVPDLGTKDFRSPEAKLVIGACLRIAQDLLPVDYVTVRGELGANISAVEFLDRAVGDTGDADSRHPAGLRAFVKRLRLRNAVAEAARDGSIIASYALEEIPDEARLAQMRELAAKILGLGSASDLIVPLSELVSDEIALLEKVRSGDALAETIRTGIRSLDDILYVEPGDLLVIGGDTSSGKSALCGQIAVNVAKEGRPVIFITSEMSHRQMLIRIAAAATEAPIASLVNPRIAADAHAEDVYKMIAGLPLYFQRTFPPMIAHASAAIRAGVLRHGAKLAIIDYAQRLADHDADSQEQAVAKIAAESKNLALSLGIVVIAAAQVNREVTKRRDPRPVLADLRGSGRLEQDANAVVFVYQPRRYGKGGSPELIVAKQRNGKTGGIDVTFNGEHCTFGEVDHG